MWMLAVRTALVALIAFMPTNPNGALGSLDYKKEERRALAIKSREAAPKFGTPERQKLIDEIHEYMLSKAPPVPQLSSPSQAPEEQSANKEGEALVILSARSRFHLGSNNIQFSTKWEQLVYSIDHASPVDDNGHTL